MATYKVIMERVIIEQHCLHIEADTMEEAAQIAMDDHADDDFDDVTESTSGIYCVSKLDEEGNDIDEEINVHDFKIESMDTYSYVFHAIKYPGHDFQNLEAQKEREKLAKVAGAGKASKGKSKSI